MAEFKILQNGDGIFYQIENLYGITTTLSRYEFLNCTISSTFSSVSDNHFDWYDLFAVSDTGFCCAVGAVLKNKTTGKFYILRYCDYDSSYFYADGTFARNNRVTLYAIDDENVINDINALLNQVPEDELDWLASKDPSEIAKIVSAVIFFGVIPLAIIVFCVITLIKTKKKMYRAPLIVLMSSAVVLLISAIILYF